MFRSTPLHLACRHNQPAIVKLLLQYQANPDVKDRGGSSSVHWAAQGSAEIVQLLLDNGATLDIGDNDGITPRNSLPSVSEASQIGHISYLCLGVCLGVWVYGCVGVCVYVCMRVWVCVEKQEAEGEGSLSFLLS